MRYRGGLAQLGEHLLCKQGVVGSIPSSSTIDKQEEELVASVELIDANQSLDAQECIDSWFWLAIESWLLFFNNL